jgi:phage/plasmid-like protein (TIGR03299 family)
LDIVGASSGDAIVDTCGVINEGREFFASIDLGPLVIDPSGINDKIQRYLLVRNGHDGKTPITYANTSVRAVCKNTVNAGMKSALRVFTARHTKNQDTVVNEARQVLDLSAEWSKDLTNTAQKMLRIPIPPSSLKLDSLINSIFPAKPNESARQRKNREEINEIVRMLYISERNGGGFGFNGWSAYNTVVEYFDHFRDADPDDRAVSSMDPTSWVSRKKEDAQNSILSMAGGYS